jgi:hypothetical protein
MFEESDDDTQARNERKMLNNDGRRPTADDYLKPYDGGRATNDGSRKVRVWGTEPTRSQP